MKIRQMDGSEIDGLENLHTDHHISLFLAKGLVLKVPHDVSTYQIIARKLKESGAEFDDVAFYKTILASIAQAGVQLPNPWQVDTLLIDESPRTCFWQEHISELCRKNLDGSLERGDGSGITFARALPLQHSLEALRLINSGRYCGETHVKSGDREVFFDWDLYFLFLFERHFEAAKNYTRSNLENVCNEIVTQ